MRSENRDDAIYRILDANANRAGEGLRTIEEYTRFVVSDLELTQRLKGLRHGLAGALARLPRDRLLSARDAAGDVGGTIALPTELNRPNLGSVISAASTRVQQAMRCMEEYGKLLDVEFARQVEQFRYQSYDCLAQCERQASARTHRQEKLATAVIYALVVAQESEEVFLERLRLLSHAGVDVVQLRDHRATDRVLFERACVGAKVARELGILFIVNDRADIATGADCDGVHVGQSELPVSAAREIVGPERLVGLSTHTIEQIEHAYISTADYVGCGPVFPSRTKTFSEYPGVDFLGQAKKKLDSLGKMPGTVGVERSGFPAFAIGGITSANIALVAATGFQRIAISEALADGSTLVATTKSLREALASVATASTTNDSTE